MVSRQYRPKPLPPSPLLNITTFPDTTMADRLTDGQQQPATAVATFDQLVESLEDIESLTGGDDWEYIDEVLCTRKFLVDLVEYWELSEIRNALSFRLPKFDYDGEVLTFKMTMDTFHNAIARKLEFNCSCQLWALHSNNEVFSEFLKENKLIPGALPCTAASVDEKQRCGDFGISLAENHACLVGEVC